MSKRDLNKNVSEAGSLMIGEKLPLLSGVGMWHTSDCNGLFPVLHISDGPHGLRKQEESAKENNDSMVSTCFPTASALAASFDEELVGEVGEMIAKQAYNADVSVLLGPGVNIKRSPLCGRNFEYFSEDPFLAGKLGASYVKRAEAVGVGTSLKHFAGNSQETCRMISNSRIDERTLREIYLSAFEEVVKTAKPSTVMASYNYLNGEKSCENKRLLTDILRKDWGFEGVVVSDWGACTDLTKAVKAGMNLEMPQSLGVHTKKLAKAYDEGRITDEELSNALLPLEKLVNSLAVENRTKDKYKGLRPHELALRAACQSAVLLKNEENILPLSGSQSVVVIGDLAKNMRFQGGGSSHINTGHFPDAVECLKKAGLNVEYAKGYRSEKVARDTILEDEAIGLVKKHPGTICLFFGGLTDITEGEGYDRSTLSMPRNQTELFKKLKTYCSKMVFVSFGGAPYDMFFEKDVKAILHMYLGGEAVGEATAALLTGSVNPSGKLAETFPLKLEDTPAFGNFATGAKEITYSEGLFVGYRHYDKNNIPVRFPFGYGLSYTTFEYSDLEIVKREADGHIGFTVSFVVTNTGKVAGKETAQLYVINPDDGFPRAVKELRGFAKVALNRGESKRVSIALEDRAFSIFDTELNSFNVAFGKYGIGVGPSSDKILLKGEVEVFARSIGKDYSKDHTGTGLDTFIGNNDSRLDDIKPGEFSLYNSLGEMAPYSWLARLLLKLCTKYAYMNCKNKAKDDPEVMMMIKGIKEGPIDCVVCQGGGLIPYRLAEKIVAQANRH